MLNLDQTSSTPLGSDKITLTPQLKSKLKFLFCKAPSAARTSSANHLPAASALNGKSISCFHTGRRERASAHGDSPFPPQRVLWFMGCIYNNRGRQHSLLSPLGCLGWLCYEFRPYLLVLREFVDTLDYQIKTKSRYRFPFHFSSYQIVVLKSYLFHCHANDDKEDNLVVSILLG